MAVIYPPAPGTGLDRPGSWYLPPWLEWGAVRGFLVAAALLVASGCGGAASARPSPIAVPATPASAPTRDPSKDSLPLLADVHSSANARAFQGGDDHVTLIVDNRGRDIQDLVLESAPWLAGHPLGMGSTPSCEPDLAAGVIDCGPVYSGQSKQVLLRAFPADVGTFHYEMRLYDREGGRLVPIAGVDGRPALITFDEVVEPVTRQLPGGLPQPSPSATG